MFDRLPVNQDTACAFIERELCFDEISVVHYQHRYAVVWAGTLLVGCQCEYQVPVRTVPFSFESQECCDPNRGLCLIVRRAATIEVAIFFGKHEGIGSPILTACLDHVDVGEQKDRL